jgi:hypothetical protein
MTKLENWEWKPHAAVGPIAFGDQIDVHRKRFALYEHERDYDGADVWIQYWSDICGLSVLTVNGRVTSVTCEKQCYYHDKNLVGIAEAKLRAILPVSSLAISKDPFGHSLVLEEFGFDAHIEDGIVTSVTVSVDPDSVCA